MPRDLKSASFLITISKDIFARLLYAVNNISAQNNTFASILAPPAHTSSKPKMKCKVLFGVRIITTLRWKCTANCQWQFVQTCTYLDREACSIYGFYLT